MARLGIWLVLALAGWAYAFWIYRRRELAVPGRDLLAFLRGAALAVILLLLLDISLPGGSDSGEVWRVVDRSSSMRVADASASGERAGPTPGATGGASDGEAGATASTARDVAFGEVGGSLMAPALARALEAGAAQVEVVSDLRIEDPVAVEAMIAQTQVPVRIVDVGGPVRNAGVAALDAPSSGEGGATVSVEVRVFGSPSERVRVEVTGGQLPWDTTFALGGAQAGASGTGDPGLAGDADGSSWSVARFSASVTLPEAAGDVALRARVVLAAGVDAFPDDDVRSAVVAVDGPAGEVVLVSWTPDWEPRFLLPLLEEVTGLATQGYLRIGPDRFITMRGRREVVSESEVALRVGDARLAVVHARPDSLSTTMARVLARSPRLLTLPGSVSSGDATPGEWYVLPDIPSSPLAGELTGIPVSGLPPLGSPVEPRLPGRSVVDLQRSGGGATLSGLVLSETSSGRRAEATGYGYWRWQMREGAPRELYRRLWSATAGWLLSGSRQDERELGLGPQSAVVPPSASMAWRAGPAAGNRITVALTPESGVTGDREGDAVEPLTVPVDSLGRAVLPAPGAPGEYRWEAEVLGGEEEGRTATGLLVVEPGDLDLLASRAVGLAGVASARSEGARPADSRPLRTHPASYLLLLSILFAEWALRRQRGLR